MKVMRRCQGSARTALLSGDTPALEAERARRNDRFRKWLGLLGDRLGPPKLGTIRRAKALQWLVNTDVHLKLFTKVVGWKYWCQDADMKKRNPDPTTWPPHQGVHRPGVRWAMRHDVFVVLFVALQRGPAARLREPRSAQRREPRHWRRG